jgi:hypothetical protein
MGKEGCRKCDRPMVQSHRIRSRSGSRGWRKATAEIAIEIHLSSECCARRRELSLLGLRVRGSSLIDSSINHWGRTESATTTNCGESDSEWIIGGRPAVLSHGLETLSLARTDANRKTHHWDST